MANDIEDKIKHWQEQNSVALTPDAYASLLKMASADHVRGPLPADHALWGGRLQ